MKKVLVTIIASALFLISANARKSRIENRVERMKARTQVEQTVESQTVNNQAAAEEVDPQMSVNPYAIYDEILANKQNYDLLYIENAIFTLDNMLNYAKTDANFLDENTKNGLIEKRAELAEVAQEKGSTKY